jgi:hypothetical protein
VVAPVGLQDTTNKSSMQLDAAVYYGYFNFFLGKHYAVDEQLYRQIIFASARESCTSSISKRLIAGAYDAFYADYQLYLSAVGCDKIRPKKKQRIMDFLQEATDDRQLGRLKHRKNDKSSTVRQLHLSVTVAKNKKEADVVFSTIL